LTEDAHYLASRLGDGYRETFGELDKALAAYEMGLELAICSANQHRHIIMLSLVGALRFELGIGDSEEALQQAYDLSKEQNDFSALSHVLQNLSYIYGVQEKFELAKKFSREAVMVAREKLQLVDTDMRLEQELFFGLLNLGEADYKLGNIKEALETRQEALKFAKTKKKQLWIGFALHELGEMYHSSGNIEEAERCLFEAHTIYQRKGAKAELALLDDFLTVNNYSFTS